MSSGNASAEGQRRGGAKWSRRRRVVVLLAVAAIATGAGPGVKYARHYVLPKRFAVVEAGQLYRSGECQRWPLERLIRERHLKTILTLLAPEPESAAQAGEEAAAREAGVRIVRVAMPGDGCAAFELLDEAADVIADPANRPLLVHCSGGVNRTGAAYAAYRMRHCGWGFEQALAEAERYGYSAESTPQLATHLRRYYQERVAATRPATRASMGVGKDSP